MDFKKDMDLPLSQDQDRPGEAEASAHPDRGIHERVVGGGGDVGAAPAATESSPSFGPGLDSYSAAILPLAPSLGPSVVGESVAWPAFLNATPGHTPSPHSSSGGFNLHQGNSIVIDF